MAGDLPEVMIFEILVRVPAKSLLRCKSVCKQWLSITSNPHFIKSHLHCAIMASRDNPTLLYIEDPPSNLAFNKDMGLQIIGTYNGIICSANGLGNVVYLWNPTIRKCKKLPAPKLYYKLRNTVFKVGFGYDSISDDYKVLRVVYENKDDVVPLVQVYSTNADSWREFRDPILKNRVLKKPANIVVNGVLYFITWNELISFDWHNEVFGLIPFHSFFRMKGSDLLDFEGSVAMVFDYGLWTLDDVSGKVSWTRRFSIEIDRTMFYRLSCYLGAGQFYGLMMGTIILYDYEKKKTTNYGWMDKKMRAALKHTDTLVSLDGFEQEDSAYIDQKSSIMAIEV